MARSRAIAAGLVLIRRTPEIQALIVHPGGPFWARKENGAWSIPKGLIEEGESALDAARRETSEELGIALPEPPFFELGEARFASGKRVIGFATELDFDVACLSSNEVEMEWPPKSGNRISFPEVDRAAWVSLERARVLLNAALIPFVERALSDEAREALAMAAKESR